MEILHTINLIKAKVPLENVELDDTEKRNSYVLKTPTTTFPFLETEKGNISESRAIQYYLCEKYKPELLGENIDQRAKVNQWCEFACCEICHCLKELVYPIFGWNKYCKKSADIANNKIKGFLKTLEQNLGSNEYICGNKMTIADILLFRNLRFLMMLHFPEQLRKSLFPKTTKWFEKIMNTPEAIKAYGRTVLCKNPIKAFTGEVKRYPIPTNKENVPEETPKETKETKQPKKKEEINQNEDDKKQYIDPDTGEQLSKSEFKRRQKMKKKKEDEEKKKADKKAKASEGGENKKSKQDEEELDPTKYFENRKAWLEKK